MAIDTKLRYNPEAGEVELVVGDSVAMASGKDVFDSWGKHWAEANGYVHESTIPEPKEETPVSEPAPEAKPVEEPNPSENERPGNEDKNADNASQEDNDS